MEGYCGKDCGACGWREQTNCPGCQEGPGRVGFEECGIAACCREKGHASCGTCTRFGFCGLRGGCAHAPEERQRRARERQACQARLAAQAPALGKWLWVMFWLFIPNLVGSLLSNESVAGAWPAAGTVGAVITMAVALAYGFALWQLREISERYRTAVVCRLWGAVFSVADAAVRHARVNVLWLLGSIVILAVTLYGVYQECNAHAGVAEYLDAGLSQKWRKIWKWNVGLTLGLFVCVPLTLLSVGLGLAALLSDGVGMIVVGILNMIYLYRTAKLFREYVPAGLPEEGMS